MTRRDLLLSGLGLGAGIAAATVGLSAVTDQPEPVRPVGRPAPMRPPEVPQRPLEVLWTALRRHRTDPCRLAFTGSSTTAGASASDAAHRYVDLVAAALQEAHPGGGTGESPVQTSPLADFGAPLAAAGVHVYNAGEGGTRSTDYLRAPKAERVAALRPAAVVHMIGANDYRSDVPPEVYRAGLEQSADTLRGFLTGPCVHVLVHSYQPVDARGRAARHPWSAYGAVLQQVAEQGDDSVFVDLSGSYRRLGVPGDDPLGLLAPDLLHQSDAGHAVMAELLLRELLPG